MLVLSVSGNSQKLQNLPVKVKSQEVMITLHTAEHIKAYLIDIKKDTFLTVPEKSMVKEALKNNCIKCSRIHDKSVYTIKAKESVLNKVMIGAAYVLAGSIWAMSGDHPNSDGLSQRQIRMFLVIAFSFSYGQIIHWIYKNTDSDEYDLLKLKKKSSKTRFYRKCNEKVRDFILYGRMNKTYSFYIGEDLRKVKGKVVKKDIKEVIIVQEESGQSLLIDSKKIKCVK